MKFHPKVHSTAIACALFVVFCATVSGAQMTMSPAPSATGALPHLALSADLLAGLPRRTVTVTEEKGETAAYSGVDLGALLGKNGAPQGAALRGSAVADYALVRATDGYRAVFALAELDPTVSDKIVILADQRNGAPLSADLGPFRIIVPGEKHHVRWVRNVTEVDVLTAP